MLGSTAPAAAGFAGPSLIVPAVRLEGEEGVVVAVVAAAAAAAAAAAPVDAPVEAATFTSGEAMPPGELDQGSVSSTFDGIGGVSPFDWKRRCSSSASRAAAAPRRRAREIPLAAAVAAAAAAMAGEDVGGNEGGVGDPPPPELCPKTCFAAVRGVFSGMFRLLMIRIFPQISPPPQKKKNRAGRQSRPSSGF